MYLQGFTVFADHTLVLVPGENFRPFFPPPFIKQERSVCTMGFLCRGIPLLLFMNYFHTPGQIRVSVGD